MQKPRDDQLDIALSVPATRVTDEHALDEARALGSSYLGTEHLLRGVFWEPNGLARYVLAVLGISRLEFDEWVDAQPTDSMDEGDRSGLASTGLPLTSAARRAMALARIDARRMGHGMVDTEHVLLGLAREERGVAGRFLRTLAPSPEMLAVVIEQKRRTVPPDGYVGTSSTGGYEVDAQFALFTEQLETCRDLLLLGSVPKARMALILLDNLAELLVFRLSERRFSDPLAPDAWPARYTNRQERAARRSFGARLEVVKAASPSLVTDSREAVIRVGHAYRNAAYHRDHHTDVVLHPLGSLLFEAVCALWVESHDRTHLSGVVSDTDVIKRSTVQFYGPVDSETTWYELAQRIVRKLLPPLAVNHRRVCEVFGADLRERAEWLSTRIPDAEAEEFAFYERYVGDPELVRLRNEEDPRGWGARASLLRRDWKPPDPASAVLADAAVAADQMSGTGSLAVSLTQYARFDVELTRLEGYAEAYEYNMWWYINVKG